MTEGGDTFAVGDHVFRWRSYLKVPFAYQEHGIVVRVVPNATSSAATSDDGGEDKDESNIGSLTRKTCQDTSIVILNFDAVIDDPEETEAKDGAKDAEKAKNKNIKEDTPTKSDDEADNMEHQDSTASSEISEEKARGIIDKEKSADEALHEGTEGTPQKKSSPGDTTHPEEAASPGPIAATAATAQSTSQHRPCRMITETYSLNDIINSPKTSEEHWEHVQYSQSQWHKRLALRAGACSPVTPDPIPVIMARMQFLQQQPPVSSNKDLDNYIDVGDPNSSRHEEEYSGTNTVSTKDAHTETDASIFGTNGNSSSNSNNNNNNNNVGNIGLLHGVPYDAHKHNGECLAVWCQTGEYISHAGAAKMGQAGLHVGTFSFVGGIAAQLAVSAVVPVVLPFMAAADVGEAVVSAKKLHQANAEWRQRTVEWNNLFGKWLRKNRDTTGLE